MRGEQTMVTPMEAFRCFIATDLDSLAIGNCILRKAEQDQSLALIYNQIFEPG